MYRKDQHNEAVAVAAVCIEMILMLCDVCASYCALVEVKLDIFEDFDA